MMDVGRRTVIGAGAALLAGLPAFASVRQPPVGRVIIDNDFAGDPDGLFQLAHHVLCTGVTIPLIVGSHLPGNFASGHDARDAAARAAEVLAIMGLDRAHMPVAGAETAITSPRSWTPSAATPLIVREAMRADAEGPLIYAAGAGLTELALAWLVEPQIGKRVKLIWIGGRPHPGIADAGTGEDGPEFNFLIDPVAAQIVFNDSDIEIWQVPQDAYRRMLFGTGELEELGTMGRLGAHLKAAIDGVPAMLAGLPGGRVLPRTDAYVLGDSPLVTLSTLVTPFTPDAASSRYRQVPTPRLDAAGNYIARRDGRPMRVYTDVDAGLTFRDMMARFRMFALRSGSRRTG